jgi:hypothetical protein
LDEIRGEITKKIKVQGSNKSQIEESQNQGPKCKRHVSSGTEINQNNV